jgi:hypothetical protein
VWPVGLSAGGQVVRNIHLDTLIRCDRRA